MWGRLKLTVLPYTLKAALHAVHTHRMSLGSKSVMGNAPAGALVTVRTAWPCDA